MGTLIAGWPVTLNMLAWIAHVDGFGIGSNGGAVDRAIPVNKAS
jgi:hypothetical protein